MGDYLHSELRLLPDRILVAHSGEQVMMAWERPLMERLAAIAARPGGEVLEIGFGLGLSASAVQARQPRRHVLVEAHPQLADAAETWAAGRPSVTLLRGRWQDRVADLSAAGPFDGVLFDVFGGDAQRLAFFGLLPRLLRPGGVATLWLGDERALPADLASLLTDLGYRWSYSRVTAIPPPDCTYSRSNEFWLPVIAPGTRAC